MLQLQNITKHFDQSPVLDNLNITFHKGETTVILGPSGSGKSTLLRTIDLLEIPDSGTLTLADISYTFPQHIPFSQLKAYRQNLSVVFQAYNLFPHMTVLQNIIAGPVYVKKQSATHAIKQAKQLLEKVGLTEKTDAYPKDLSGGQMQRVAIARALMMEPKFILYDEPTSSLDPELAQEVLNVIKQLADSSNSQIIVTHHVAFAKKIADRIIFLENGKIIFDGLSEVFFASNDTRIQQYLKQLL